MHELSIAERLLPPILETAAEHDAEQVTAVTLRVGALQQIVVPSLQLCFGVVCEGTIAAGATLTVETVEVIARCRRCGDTFAVEEFVFVCPVCGVAEVDTIQGDELILTRVELTRCESTSSTTS